MFGSDGVRAAVEAVEAELALLASGSRPGGGDGLVRLHATWKKLTDALALGPAPHLRTCPRCGGTGMAAATRCGNCWEPLIPLPGPPVAAA